MWVKLNQGHVQWQVLVFAILSHWVLLPEISYCGLTLALAEGNGEIHYRHLLLAEVQTG